MAEKHPETERLYRYAKPAGLLAGCLLLCLGMYYGAKALADHRFEQAIKEAEHAEAENREDAFHFNTLSAKEQMIYDAIADAAEDFREQSAILSFVPTENEYASAMQAFLLDNPWCFYVSADACTLSVSTYTAAVEMAYCEAPEGRLAQLQGAVDKIMAGIPKTNERETALLLHDALTASCAYPSQEDGEAAAGCTAYDALVGGMANGYGYALAYQLLCEEAGLVCETVTGTAGGGSHAWNCVTADLQTGYTDVMWDDVPNGADAEDRDGILPFHGYEFLSYREMALDHTPDSPDIWKDGNTDNYYERNSRYAENAESLPVLLEALLSEAGAAGDPFIEFAVGEAVSDYILEGYLHAAVTAANASAYDNGLPRLRTVNRVYHASDVRCARTVRLFYENAEDEAEP
ncbi:MAG: hypothetical protein ACI3XM_01085 [Eubacteriales bacterium]